MGGIVTPAQLSEVRVTVNTLRGLIAGLVHVTRGLEKRYPEDGEVATLRVEFAGLLCEANKAKVEMDLLCQGAAVRPSEAPVMARREQLRPPVVGYGMLAAHDDSLFERGGGATADSAEVGEGKG